MPRHNAFKNVIIPLLVCLCAFAFLILLLGGFIAPAASAPIRQPPSVLMHCVFLFDQAADYDDTDANPQNQSSFLTPMAISLRIEWSAGVWNVNGRDIVVHDKGVDPASHQRLIAARFEDFARVTLDAPRTSFLPRWLYRENRMAVVNVDTKTLTFVDYDPVSGDYSNMVGVTCF